MRSASLSVFKPVSQASRQCSARGRCLQQVSFASRKESTGPLSLDRRHLGLAFFLLAPSPALASGRTVGRKKIPESEYTPLGESGLAAYELTPGAGRAIEYGDKVVVHFTVLFKGITVVSSRLARTLEGNRTIAEPVEVTAGKGASDVRLGGDGPKPPPALAQAVIGMKKGGQRSLIVPSELGYPKGLMELPAGSPCELQVEVLELL